MTLNYEFIYLRTFEKKTIYDRDIPRSNPYKQKHQTILTSKSKWTQFKKYTKGEFPGFKKAATDIKLIECINLNIAYCIQIQWA